MTAGELRARRAAAQRLDRPGAAGPADLVRALLAVQAQDARAARLALRARSAGLDAAAVDTAVSDDRSIVLAWLMRGTLHLVAREDHAWLLGLTAPRLLELGLIDKIIREPLGGAHRNPHSIAIRLKAILLGQLDELEAVDTKTLLERRYRRLRSYGAFTGG